jgi:isopropylmalate/homocitrate/citramalate synthase
MAYPERLTSYEVGPRDGLQNEASPVLNPIGFALIERRSASGITHIEAPSFVSPKWVPEMAGSADVMRGEISLGEPIGAGVPETARARLEAAAGNVATEDILGLLDELGIENGIDAKAVAKAGHFILQALNRRQGDF